MTTDGSPTTIASVERALDVLDLFTQDGVTDLGVTEVAERMELSKAVVHRILSTFRVKGYVHLDPDTRRYHLGVRTLTLGLAYLGRIDAAGIARDALRELSERTGETATLSVRVDWRRVYVDQVTPPRDIKMVVQLGGSYPLHAGASSKAMLAALPDEVVQCYLDDNQLDALTDLTITEPDALQREIHEVRERGFAMSLGERQEGAGSVAAPLYDRDGQPIAVVSVCGPVERFRAEADQVAPVLVEVTSEVSEALGHLDAPSVPQPTPQET